MHLAAAEVGAGVGSAAVLGPGGVAAGFLARWEPGSVPDSVVRLRVWGLVGALGSSVEVVGLAGDRVVAVPVAAAAEVVVLVGVDLEVEVAAEGPGLEVLVAPFAPVGLVVLVCFESAGQSSAEDDRAGSGACGSPAAGLGVAAAELVVAPPSAS